VFHIHDRLTPVHKAFVLKIDAKKLPERLKEKALLGTFDSKGKIEAAGGEYSDGYLTASIRSFGDYFILVAYLRKSFL